MNKRIFLILGLAATTIASASARQLTYKEKQTQRKMLVRAIMNNQTKTANKTTAILSERMIAQSDYGDRPDSSGGSIWGITDSVNYRYSGTRGSRYNYNFMECTNFFDGYGGSPFAAIPGFLVRNGKPGILSDNSNHWMLDFSSSTYAFVFSDTTGINFTTGNNVLKYDNYYPVASATLGMGVQFVNIYNTSGDISKLYMNLQNSTAWDSFQYREFVYSSSGNLVMDSAWFYDGSSWSMSDKYTYTYDGLNRITAMSYYSYDGSGWAESNRYNMEYNSANQLIKVNQYAIDAGTPVLEGVDSFGYTASLNFFTYEDFKYYDMGSVLFHNTSHKHINSAINKPDTVIVSDYDVDADTAWSKTMTAYTYDSYNEPILANSYFYDYGTSTYNLTGTHHYYYDTFENVGIKNTSLITGLQVYPNPATNTINVMPEGISQGATLKLQLLNTTGQVVVNMETTWQNNAISVPVSGLAPGVYFVVAEDATTHTQYRQTVVKQ